MAAFVFSLRKMTCRGNVTTDDMASHPAANYCKKHMFFTVITHIYSVEDINNNAACHSQYPRSVLYPLVPVLAGVTLVQDWPSKSDSFLYS